MDLIEDEPGAEAEVRHGLSDRSRRPVMAALALVGLALVVALFRPSTQSGGEAPTTTAEPAVQPAEDSVADDRNESSPSQTLLRPDRLAIPESVDIDPAARRPLTLIGQNESGQVVGVDLASGRVAEFDPVSGQLFKPRVSSNERVAGFRVFLGEAITIGADGTLRSLPVTEMDLPIIFTAADGDGFVIHQTTTNVLWSVDNEGRSLSGALPLPDDVDVRAVVDDGLVLQTRDGAHRRFDPVTGQFGGPLAGSIVALGRDRYISLSCDSGPCSVSARSLNDDQVIAELDLDLADGDRRAISPSARLMAAAVGGEVVVIDLDSGVEVAALGEAGNADFVWGPDDTLLYWNAGMSSAAGDGALFLYQRDLGGSSIQLPSAVLDLAQPVHGVVSDS